LSVGLTGNKNDNNDDDDMSEDEDADKRGGKKEANVLNFFIKH
jgi:hypothetical protein